MSKGDVRVTVAIPTFNRANLLRESLTSVLSQSYRDFRLLVCDNASEDDTEETVASFADTRIDYVRSDENIGMIANFNRAIALTETEFLVLLPDDDLLYPDHLRRTVATLLLHPEVGVVHTAFDLIDGSSGVVEHDRTLVTVDGAMSVESGADYLERGMRSTWTICWPSALFRTRAVTDAGGLREDQEPMSDIPFLMRVACDWDFACLSTTLAAFRFHPDTQTAALGSFAGAGYVFDDSARMFHTQRMRFLDEATLPQESAERYRSIAEDTFCRDEVRHLAERGGLGASWMSTSRMLARLVLTHPRALLLPATWRLCGAQLGGRRARQAARRLRQSLSAQKLNAQIRKRLPDRVRQSHLFRAYGTWAHTRVRRRADREMYVGTFFLRNRPALELVRRVADGRETGSTFRIAVLGCSIGAEVYSILWVLRRARPDLEISVHALDISREVLDIAEAAAYGPETSHRVGSSIFTRLTPAESQEMFDWEGERGRVKSWLREGITWQLGDACDPELSSALGPQDLVVANNFLCHMDAESAEKCLRTLARLVTPGGHLFVSGVDLDVRTKVATDLGWEPLPDLIHESHDGDPSVRNDWPWYWWGLEPFDKSRSDWETRYASVFRIGEEAGKGGAVAEGSVVVKR